MHQTRTFRPRHCHDCLAKYTPTSANQRYCSDCGGTAKPTDSPAVTQASATANRGKLSKGKHHFSIGVPPQTGSNYSVNFRFQDLFSSVA